MGSGVNSSGQGKYVGVGAGGAGFVEVKAGFKPKVVKIRSVQGEVVFHEGMPGAWYQVDSGVPTFLAAAVELTEFGFKVTGNVAGVNTASTAYYYEMY